MATAAQLQADAIAAANSSLAQANTFLNGLISISTSGIIAGINAAGTIPTQYDYASVPNISFPILGGGIRPDASGISVTAPPQAPTLPTLSDLQPIPLPTDDLLAPTNEFTYFEQAYQSILLNPLQTKLLDDLTNGGYGIDPEDEAALYNRARDREAELAMTRIDEAGRAMAARGFPLPPGELSIAIDRAHQEFQGKTSAISREIFVNAATRFVENRRFTIEQVRNLEQITIGFHNSIQERAVNVSRIAAEMAITVYNATLARYKTRLDAAKITSDVQLAQAQVEVERVRAQLELFRGQIAAFEADIRRQVEPLRIQTDLYRADIDANRALTDAFISKASLQQKALEATVTQNTDISRLTMESLRAKAQLAISGIQLGMESSKFGSALHSSILAAIWGSINSLAVQSATEE